MWNITSLGLLFVLISLLLASDDAIYADEVQLSNGDRLTGQVVKMEEGVLLFSTPYGGEIKIDWQQVQRVRSDEPMTIQLRDPSGALSLAELFFLGGKTISTSELTPGGAIPLPDVLTINVKPVRYQGAVTIGGNSTQGNTQTKAVNAAARFSIRSNRQRVNLEAKYNYGEANERVTARNYLGSFEYNFFVSSKTFIQANTLLENDTFQNLLLRTTAGAGAGYQFLETKRNRLSGELGLAYVNEHYRNVAVRTTPSSRWMVRWEHFLVLDKIKLFHFQEGYYDLNSGNAIRLRADQGIRVSIYKGLFFNLEYDLRFNSGPAPGRKQTDEAYIFGVGYQFE